MSDDQEKQRINVSNIYNTLGYPADCPVGGPFVMFTIGAASETSQFSIDVRNVRAVQDASRDPRWEGGSLLICDDPGPDYCVFGGTAIVHVWESVEAAQRILNEGVACFLRPPYTFSVTKYPGFGGGESVA